jgi:hypothetical protein
VLLSSDDIGGELAQACYCAMGGGAPLSRQGERVAGVGVSGGTVEQDIAILEAALGDDEAVVGQADATPAGGLVSPAVRPQQHSRSQTATTTREDRYHRPIDPRTGSWSNARRPARMLARGGS